MVTLIHGEALPAECTSSDFVMYGRSTVTCFYSVLSLVAANVGNARKSKGLAVILTSSRDLVRQIATDIKTLPPCRHLNVWRVVLPHEFKHGMDILVSIPATFEGLLREKIITMDHVCCLLVDGVGEMVTANGTFEALKRVGNAIKMVVTHPTVETKRQVILLADAPSGRTRTIAESLLHPNHLVTVLDRETMLTVLEQHGTYRVGPTVIYMADPPPSMPLRNYRLVHGSIPFSVARMSPGTIVRCEEAVVSTSVNPGWREALRELFVHNIAAANSYVVGPRYPATAYSYNRGKDDDAQFIVTGKSEGAESLDRAALRELQEELGLTPQTPEDLVCVGTLDYLCRCYLYEVAWSDLKSLETSDASSAIDAGKAASEETAASAESQLPIEMHARVTVLHGTKRVFTLDSQVRPDSEAPISAALRALDSVCQMTPAALDRLRYVGTTERVHRASTFVMHVGRSRPFDPTAVSERVEPPPAPAGTGGSVAKGVVNVVVYGMLDECLDAVSSVKHLKNNNADKACGVSVFALRDVAAQCIDSAAFMKSFEHRFFEQDGQHQRTTTTEDISANVIASLEQLHVEENH